MQHGTTQNLNDMSCSQWMNKVCVVKQYSYFFFFFGQNHINYQYWKLAGFRCLGTAFFLFSPWIWSEGWDAQSLLWENPWVFSTALAQERGLEAAQLPQPRRGSIPGREHPAGGRAALGRAVGLGQSPACCRQDNGPPGRSKVGKAWRPLLPLGVQEPGWHHLMDLRDPSSGNVATYF